MENPDRLIAFIRQTIPVNRETAAVIAENFEFRILKKGSFFLREDNLCSEYMFLESGFLRAFIVDTDGNEVTVQFFAPDGIVFEPASFFQKVKSQENIQVLAGGNGWVITFDALNGLFHDLPEFREFGRAVLVKALITLKTRTVSMINQTAEERYEALLKSNPVIFENAPLKHVASYLGITDTSLSRIRAAYARK